MPTSIKLAYIGGGSRHWAPVMMRDLALAKGLQGELALYDIHPAAAARNADFGNRIFQHPDAVSPFHVTHSSQLTDTLSGADFVLLSILPGPMACFANDLTIPLQHGWVQTVGDTIGPGGLSRALRTIPIYRDFARAIAEYCPQAWVINYTNPMTLATQALTHEVPWLKTIGCCHEVFSCRAWIGQMAAEYTGIPLQHRNEVDIDLVGLNHFTFFTRASYHGHDVFPAINAWIDRQGDFFRDRTQDALGREAKGRFGSCDGLIQLDFLRRFGVFGAAGDRHLVEFVPWYGRTTDTLRRWGVSVTGAAQRLAGWKPDKVESLSTLPGRLIKSKEEGIDLLTALLGLTPFTTNVNVPNLGQIPWLPRGHVVETLAQIGRDKAAPLLATTDLPLALRTHVQRIADIQRLTLDAATACDFDLALQALLADPHCFLDTDKAVALLRDLIDANRPHLPSAWC